MGAEDFPALAEKVKLLFSPSGTVPAMIGWVDRRVISAVVILWRTRVLKWPVDEGFVCVSRIKDSWVFPQIKLD